MHAHPDAAASDAARLRARGLRVTGPRLAILSMLQAVGGHRSADELVAALREGGYHHARTTVYNTLDDLARAGLVRAAPVDAGALRYEVDVGEHHHFVCRECGLIINVPVAPEVAAHPIPKVDGATADEIDVIYRGLCAACAAAAGEVTRAAGRDRPLDLAAEEAADIRERSEGSEIQVGGEEDLRAEGSMMAANSLR